jgi:PKD repeat protein
MNAANPTWVDLTSKYSTAPPARAYAAMAYDAADGYSVLYGGSAGTTLYGDTWSFTTTAGWTKLGPATAPPSLTEPTMTYDAGSSKIVMFGGCEGLLYCPESETWTYSGGNWAQFTTGTAPTANLASGMAYDAADSEVVMFGGCSSINTISQNCNSGSYLATTYKFTTSAGWSSVTSASSPTARTSPGMAYDPVLKEVLLYGGYDGTNSLSDMWSFSAGTWTPMSPTSSPGALSNFDMFWDTSLNEMIIFGGDTQTSTSANTWAFSNNAWTKLTPTTSPPGRDGSVCAAPTTGPPIIWGGNVNNNTVADTWAFGVPPSAQISANPTSADVSDSVTFSATVSSSNPPVTSSWSLGDGTTSAVANFTHSYSKPGLMVANFTATDSYGLVATKSVDLTITALPLVLVAANPLTIQAGNTTSFWANETGGMSPLNYTWNFGDNAYAYTADATHSYAQPGSYMAQATVTDAASHHSSATVNITVKAKPGALQVSYSAVPTSGLSPLPVTFTSTVSGGVSPYTYVWNYGDGSPKSYAPNPSHTFNSSGKFLITLNVSDSQAHSGTYAEAVSVHAGPMSLAPITATPAMGSEPLSVAFASLVSGGQQPYTYLWKFGDNTTSTAQDPSHVYNSSGLYVASIQVADSPTDGQTDRSSVNITVYPALTVTVSRPGTASPGETVNFTAYPAGGDPPYYFNWTFGTSGSPVGTGSTNFTSHEFPAGGVFNVTVSVTDALAGSYANATVNVTVEVAAVSSTTSFTFDIFGDPMWPLYLFVPAIVAAVVAAVLIISSRKRRPPQMGYRRRTPSPELSNFREPPYYQGFGWD